MILERKEGKRVQTGYGESVSEGTDVRLFEVDALEISVIIS